MIKGSNGIIDSFKENCVEILSENLSALCAKAGLTQEAATNIIAVSRQTYYSIEAGKRSMT